MKKSAFVVALLLSVPIKGFAEDLPYPETLIISSDFGPRQGYKSHVGIDILPTTSSTTAKLGFPIRTIKEGVVTAIGKTNAPKEKDAAWYITIESELSDGQKHEISYLHIFENGSLSTATPRRGIRSPDGRFELRISSVTRRYYIIRRPSGVDVSTAIYATGAGFPVPDFPSLLTTRSVLREAEIAPTGNSGTDNPHLHLAIDKPGLIATPGRKALNPLLFLPHGPLRAKNNSGKYVQMDDAISQFKIKFLNLCGFSLHSRDVNYSGSSSFINAPFRIEIDSRSGLDLNRVKATLSGPTETFIVGMKDLDGAPQWEQSFHLTQRPVSKIAGLDQFQFPPSIEVPAILGAGAYSLNITAMDISGQTKTESCSFDILPASGSLHITTGTATSSYSPGAGFSADISLIGAGNNAQLYVVSSGTLSYLANTNGQLQGLSDGSYLVVGQSGNGDIGSYAFTLGTGEQSLQELLASHGVSAGSYTITGGITGPPFPETFHLDSFLGTSGGAASDLPGGEALISFPAFDGSGSGVIGAALVEVSTARYNGGFPGFNRRLIFYGPNVPLANSNLSFRPTNVEYLPYPQSETELSGENIQLRVNGNAVATDLYTRGNWSVLAELSTGPIALVSPYQIGLSIHANTAPVCFNRTDADVIMVDGERKSECIKSGFASPAISSTNPLEIFTTRVLSHVLTPNPEFTTSGQVNYLRGAVSVRSVAGEVSFISAGLGRIELLSGGESSALIHAGVKYAPVPTANGLSLGYFPFLSSGESLPSGFDVKVPFSAGDLTPAQISNIVVIQSSAEGVSVLPSNISGNELGFRAILGPSGFAEFSIVRLDTVGPGDLSIASAEVAHNFLSFAWTATGDDGDEGIASVQDVRAGVCSDETSFANNFDFQPKVGEGSSEGDEDYEPQVPGTGHLVGLGDLAPNTKYCLAARVEDSAGNRTNVFSASAITAATPYESIDTGESVPGLVFEYPLGYAPDVQTLASSDPLAQQFRQNVEGGTGDLLASDVFHVGPDGTHFHDPARVKIKYDRNFLAQNGIDEAQLKIYESLPSGAQLYFVLPGQTQNSIDQTLSAPVSALNSRFAIFGAALPDPNPDNNPPRTTLLVGVPSVTLSSTVYLMTSSSLAFTVADDKLTLNDGLGVGATQTFYAIDASAYMRYSQSLMIGAEGSHVLSFYSVDLSGNTEAPQQQTLFVDMTPPVTQLNQNGAEIALDAFDPSIAGGASGVARIRYLVDFSNPEVCNNVPEDTNAPRGTCENPWYDGPFTLPSGDHSIHFQAFDNVGNAESLQSQSVYVNVGSSGGGNDVGGLGIGRDPLDTLWTVNADTESISFAHADSSGALISSATLQDAADGLPWSVFFNVSGRAYAIGMAEGPETQALDLAIYKASPSGDAIESRTLFDSGYASNDLVFDAKAPGWIVGGAQTAGPTDMDADGDRSVSLALWRFDPALGSVQLSTSTSRAGFDFGSGLAVDADGSLWIVGYSAQPNAPDVGGLDLALRHYAADGQTLLGGPYYKPSYLSHLDGGITAKVHVTADAVYVAAPRLSASGGSDMAFLKFNKATGQALVEKVWRAADGSSSYPVAILPEATGLLVAGGIGDFETDAGLWRFGYDGDFLSATTADAGGAQGAVFKGSELWLSVDGSTTPYRVQDEVSAAGALIDLLPPRTSLLAGEPSFAGDSTVYVTSATPLGFAVVDDYLVPGDGLGAGATQTFYTEAGGSYSRFTSSFTLVAEGTHTISFYSIDLAGRVEAAKIQSIGVDLTAPVVTLISSGSIFSLSAVDPVVGGAASGVEQIQYLVDHEADCPDVAQSTASPPGTCENLAYAGPFELAAGTHTIYYAATDRVSNGAEITYSSFVAVSQASSFLAVSADGSASLSSSRADETVTAVSTESVAAAYAAAVGIQGLVLMSPSLYEISPSPVVFDPPALLSIRFDPSSISAATVALYRFDGALWSSAPVTGQQVSVFSATSAVVSGFLNGASLYGVFSIAPPPLAISSIDPISGTNAGSVGVTVTGTGFASGDSLKLSRLSPTANAWTSVGFNFFSRSRFPAVTLPNGKVLVEGGEGTTSSPNISGAELFNPSLGTWSMTAPMPVPRRYHTATLLNSGRVLVAGGVGGNSTALLYDPSAETWSATGSMSSGHYYHTATLMPNGKVLVAGGFDAGATAACAVYDPAAGTFSPTQSLSSARYYHTATLLPNGKVLVAGGLQGSTTLASTEIYDPSAGTWSLGAPMAINRDNHTATLLANGTVLVAGGSVNDSAFRASAEVYDPVANAWITVGSMAAPRGYHTATLLSNGFVLAAGGLAGGFLSSAELFDPNAGTWSPAPSLATARFTHAAALLADGRVLVTGGQNASGKIRAAEVYSPPGNVEIAATGINVLDSTRLTAAFDLANRPLGSWNVVVTDVDGSSAALNGGFTVLAVSPPAAVGNLALSVVNLSSVTLRWTAPSAAGGIAVTSYDLRVATFVITAANFASATPIAAPAPMSPGVVQTAAVANAAGTSFFAALISRDAAGTPSSLSNVPGLQRSAVTINGGPELSAWAGIPLSLSMVSTAAAPGSVVFATAGTQGLVRVSSLYELGPQGAFFSPSGTLVFRYSTTALTALGLTSADVRVYQYVGGTMSMLPAQTLNASAQTYTVSISSPPALFALFGFVTAPAAASIAPNSGTNTGSIGVTLSGSGLRVSDTLKLSRASTAANTWTAAGSMSTARSRFPAVLLPNGKVLVEGGEASISSPDISAAELFNPSPGTWSMTTAMPGSRRYHTATVLPNGKVLVAGGVGGETTALLYDPAAGTWTSAGTMVSSHYYHTATLLPSGRVLIAGGHVVGGGTAACEIYDPVAGTFMPAQKLTGARYQHTATLLPDGRVVVAGGFYDNTSDALSSVEIYDPSAGTWSSGASMSSSRGFHAATLLDDGTVLVAGGMNGMSLFASAEVYNPSADRWAGVGAMSVARALHTATRLPDGRVLAAGGNAGGVLGSAELFDPGTGAWSAAPSLLTARTAHAAVSLPDGRILLAGGQNVNSPLNSAEIYTPTPPADIVATGIASPSASLLTGVFNLAGQPAGTWDVVVADVFGRSSILRDGFTVAAPPRPAAVADLSIVIESASSLTLSWTGPASAAPLASYDLRRATFPITAANFTAASPLTAPSPAAPGVVQSVIVADAVEDSFFAALKSVDSLGGVSALSNVASRVRSAAVVGGQPEFTFSANVPITFVPVSTATAPGTIVLATSSAQGLTLVSSIYDLGPEGAVFNPNAQMTFVYSPDALASLGLLPGDIKIYQFVPGAGMVEVSSQTIDTAANTITGYVPSLSSIFAVFGVVRDRAAPITSLSRDANGTFTDGSGNLYASASAGFGFSAYDPVVAGTASGVAYTNYRVDGPSTAPFSRFASTFSLSGEGLHELDFFSADNAGNVEVVRSSAVSVDATAPVTTPQVLGSSVAGVSGGLAVSSAAAISLTAVDPVSNGVASGLSGVFYVVDADPAHPACAGATPDAGAPNGTCANPSYAGSFSLPPGEHVVYYFAKDNVANAETRGSLPVLVDAVAPLSVLLVNGTPMTASSAVLVSTNSIGLSASDSGSGVSRILYALDGAVEQVYASTFTLPAGSHVLSFRGEDRVGNVETARSVTLDVLLYDAAPPTASLSIVEGSTITTDTPLIAAAYGDSGRGVDVSSVRLALDGMDVTTQAAISASSAAFSASLPQGAHVVSISLSDLAGNEASAAARFFVDSLPPGTILQVNGLDAAMTALVVVSTDALGFVSTDAGTGVARTEYALDGGVPTVYTSTFSLAAGAHSLVFYSVDDAGNAETSKNVALNVLLYDVTPPAVVFRPAVGSTIATTAPQIAAVYSDAGRGVDVTSIRLSLDGVDVTAQAVVTASSAVFTSSVPLSEGAHVIAVQVADLAGNQASAASAFTLDSIAPVTTLLVNGQAAGNGGLILASTDAVAFAATDAGTGILETLYSLDGAVETVFISTFSLSPGGHSLAFRSRDRAGNLETARVVSITVTSPVTDTTPPLVRLDFPGAAASGIEQALGGVVDVRGEVSDASAVSWTLEAAPGAAAAGGFTTIASGAGNLSGLIATWNTTSLSGYQTMRFRANDAFGNAAQATATVFVGAPVMTFAIGRKDSDAIVSNLKGPTGIAVRSDGSIWVASTENDQILLISPAGVLLGAAGRAPGRSGEEKGKKDKDRDDEERGQGDRLFKTPQGLALDAAGSLYVADRDLNRVLKLSPDGQTLLLQFGQPGSGPGELRRPFDVAVDANGDVYAADAGNRRVSVFDASGAFLREFGAGVFLSTSEIRGVALTSEGLWVSDKELEVIHLFSRSGALIKTISGADSAVGELSRMRGLASDPLGALYVVEPNRDRVQKFDPRGKGLLAFGAKAGLSLADKKAKRWLTQPIDAAVGPDGAIWVTDKGRDRVVRYALPPADGGLAALSTGGGESASESGEPARRVVDHKDGAAVSRDDGSGVRVPKGALAADLEITVEKGDENVDKEPKEAKRRELKITAVSDEVQYGPEGTTFNAPVTLTIPYDANLIASRGLREDDLKVYYWNPTLQEWQAMPSTVDKQSKTVNALTTHFSAYQVGALGGIGVAAIDDFGLRDGYAFPNPSRNGSAVTFRMQPGSADSIEVRVYDVSGRKVHSSSDFRFLGALDDGNGKGAQNTYDHVWNVSGIGSGVYTFVMTAKKAGVSDARKTGKVGVIK